MIDENIGGGSNDPGSSEEWIGDGNTHIWITLPEGRTSPMLGCCPNGTVTVDWGDGTTPDVLTGTSTSTLMYTSNHEYAKPGDYVITLTVDGEISFMTDQAYAPYPCVLQHSSVRDDRSYAYSIAIRRVEFGSGITEIGTRAFIYCYGLESIFIPDGVTIIKGEAFKDCHNLRSVVIPGSIQEIWSGAFKWCYGLTSVVIQNIENYIPPELFSFCGAVLYYDFTNFTAVPYLYNTDAFNGIAPDCEIRVPAALYDQWIAATNWTTYASQIVAVSDDSGDSGDGTDIPPEWAAVFASIDAGTYKTDYAIGDTVPLDLGSEGIVNMQIAAFNADDLADGSGRAPITWVSKELVAMHTNEYIGSGIGWENCEVRDYLANTIKPLMPSSVSSKIAPVSKRTVAWKDYTEYPTQTTIDELWIPSHHEVNIVYSKLFNSDASRIKTFKGTPESWWLRSQEGDWYMEKTMWDIVPSHGQLLADGHGHMAHPDMDMGVCLCFCT